jgi:hypothetical protein
VAGATSSGKACEQVPGLDKKKCQAQKTRHDELVGKTDALLADIDKVLAESPIERPLRRLRRPGRERLGTTQPPEPGLSS